MAQRRSGNTARLHDGNSESLRLICNVLGRKHASLIVLTFNGCDVLGPCLASLTADKGPDDEIIVVDNGSVDETVSVVRRDYPDVRVVALPENRFIFGLNDGLRVAQGEYVAFLNNDIVVERGFIDSLVRGFDSDEIFAVCARILDKSGDEQGSRTAGFWEHGSLHYRSLPHRDVATDCFFAVGGQSLFRRSYLEEIGSIDELLWPMYHEDIELSYRAWKRGWRIRYAPDAVVHHLGSHTSLRVFRPQDLRTFVRQNEFLTVWKDITDPKLLAEHVLYIPPRLLTAAIRRDVPTLRGLAACVRPDSGAFRARVASARLRFSRGDREVLNLVAADRIDHGSTDGVALEDVPCPVCDSSRRSLVLSGVDTLHGLPGSWDVNRCEDCTARVYLTAPDRAGDCCLLSRELQRASEGSRAAQRVLRGER